MRIYPYSVDSKGSMALFGLRLVAGTAFVLHGWHKIQHPFSWMGSDSGIPPLFLALAALAEFGGGLAWLLGLLTPLASLGILSTMTVAMQFHITRGHPFVGQGDSFESALGYLAIALVLLLVGPGKLSLDFYSSTLTWPRSQSTRSGSPVRKPWMGVLDTAGSPSSRARVAP